MANQWYYAHGDQKKFGPFTADEMRSLAIKGDILRTDTVWLNDGPRGVLATRVQHLFPQATAPAPEPPPVAPPPMAPPPVAPEPPSLVKPPEAPRPAPAHAPVPEKKRKAIALQGATIVGQDNGMVRFRKRCTECKHEDSSYATMKITTGTMKAGFFCPKCRKKRECTLRGVMG